MINYEEITESTGAYSHGEYDCTLCCGVAYPPIQASFKAHLLKAHKLEYVDFEDLSLAVQAELQGEFGNRWYRELWYFHHQGTGELVAVGVPED